MKLLLLVCFPICLFFLVGSENLRQEDESDLEARAKKQLSFFSIVRFENGICAGSNGQNGTCYAADECVTRGGQAAGTCASGYGSCCIFTLGCGAESSENCTYFESLATVAGGCRARICPCSDNICQMRLDFASFVINQPSMGTDTVAVINNAKNAIPASQCLLDQFSVTTPGSSSPPLICGSNTGEHMIIEASDNCNELAFNLAAAGSMVTRTWSIKIMQYSCDFVNLAPTGCTQYYFGATEGLIRTYNFEGGHHLADQNQNICVRRERDFCRICYTTVMNGDFELSTTRVIAAGTVKFTSKCCGYGTKLTDTAVGYDCAMIPSAMAIGGKLLKSGAAYGFCGGELGSIAGSINAATVCSRKVPFNIRFISDHYEWPTEFNFPNGFRLHYRLTSC